MTEVISQWFIWQKIRISPGYNSEQNGRKANIWTINETFHWHNSWVAAKLIHKVYFV